ncbi:hypothetical protein [Eggerthella sp. YY7918]|uniref:hypothetical protein n=1 Tax=Eggerthella sp. (strain YY7918) TaxID=502558 RepID=UPI00030B0E22|nr:hypothetical protein [Eggerthella sp. YY7918]
MILEDIGKSAVDALLKTTVGKLRQKYSDFNSVQITNVRIGTVLPSRIALDHAISNSEIKTWDFHTFYLAAIPDSKWKTGWINSAELCFCIRNLNEKRNLVIHGFLIERTVLENSCPASYLQVPQGAMLYGECRRFAVSLDSDATAFQMYRIVDHVPQYIDESNYFAFSTLDIAPNNQLNVNLSLISNKQPRSISRITMRYSIQGHSSCIDIPLEQSIRIYPLDSIPENQRFRRTWREEAPAITTERDGSILAPDIRSCRWDDYQSFASV